MDRMLKMVNPPIIILLIALACFSLTFTLPGGEAAFPRVIIICIALLSVADIFRHIKSTEKTDTKKALYTRKQLVLVLLIVLYVVSFHIIGFFLCTIIFIPVSMLYLGYRKYVVVVYLSIGLTLFVYYTFFGYLHLSSIPGMVFD